VRGLALLNFIVVLLIAAPAATAQQPAPGTTPDQTTPAGTGGAAYAEEPVAPERPTVPGTVAVRLANGYAAAPADAPLQVQQAIWAANEIIGKPYKYGGGHARIADTGYDCSGTVSYALHGAGLLETPLPSGDFMRWGDRGKGSWITVYANRGHAFVVIAGLRLDTSAAGERRSSGKGPRWRTTPRGGRGFRSTHPAGF
jgi:hypothetical protein